MIRSIRLTNFKSIRDTEVQLSRLSVLIGANGSGKSNLIKGLDFIASIPRDGLQHAVVGAGSFYGLVPKALPMSKARSATVAIEYVSDLDPPTWYPADAPPPSVRHHLAFTRSVGGDVKVANEYLRFDRALAIAEALRAPGPITSLPKEYLDSFVSITRAPRRTVRIDSQPSPNEDTIPLFLNWFGLSALASSVTSREDVERLINSFVIAGTRPGRADYGAPRFSSMSLLDPRVPAVAGFSAHFQRFRDSLSSVRRFDLLLHQLRREQVASTSPQLEKHGGNMPAVLEAVRQSKDQAAWKRILGTFGAIAPHVRTMDSRSLATGKQFVRFLEQAAGRAVESWDASDGTLRALAILLALETHPRFSTILIEEPEQNLHPWAVRALIDHVRDVIEERSLQVVLTTHSEHVLESVRPEEVLVARRTVSDGTTFKSLDAVVGDRPLRMGEVGRLWVKGLLAGTPADYEG